MELIFHRSTQPQGETGILIDLQSSYCHKEIKKDVKLWGAFWRCLIEHLLAVQLDGKCQW